MSELTWDAVATDMSGGIGYAGGGIRHQNAAGVDGSPEQMLASLRHETAGAVSAKTRRSSCDGPVEMLTWLESQTDPSAPTHQRSADAVR